MSGTLKQLSDDIYEAEERYHEAIARAFPAGARVHVGHHATPAIVEWTRSDRVGVESVTGKRYSVYACRLREWGSR